LYNQIIRPWKSRLALAYRDRRSFWIDLELIFLTVLAITSKRNALQALRGVLLRWNLDPLVVRMAMREEPLLAYPPSGAESVVSHL